jgi:hypothetical protein
MLSLMGVEIVVSELCYEEVQVRNFPVSRHRSRRIHKKLVKRYGGEYHIVRKPRSYRVGDRLIMHPEIYAILREKYHGNP